MDPIIQKILAEEGQRIIEIVFGVGEGIRLLGSKHCIIKMVRIN